jgi:protein TonB
MKTKSVLFSVLFHAAILLIALTITFDFPAEVVSLGYGNVEFSTVAKKNPNELRKEKTKKDETIKNSGAGEPLLDETTEREIPFENERNRVTYNNGKFSIDFIGKRTRAIYSYTLPDYPNGVEKEADIVLRITIEPDGTVSRIFPLIKADTQLELAAINALKNWRFEPLPKEMPQIPQEAVVVFPYVLD